MAVLPPGLARSPGSEVCPGARGPGRRPPAPPARREAAARARREEREHGPRARARNCWVRLPAGSGAVKPSRLRGGARPPRRATAAARPPARCAIAARRRRPRTHRPPSPARR